MDWHLELCRFLRELSDNNDRDKNIAALKRLRTRLEQEPEQTREALHLIDEAIKELKPR